MSQWLWGSPEKEEVEKGLPSRPLGIWGWVALSLISPTAAAQSLALGKEGGERRIM